MKLAINKRHEGFEQVRKGEIAIELVHQLLDVGITVDKAFFDGAPFIKCI
jgi:hypothetical protein